jgi:protein-L-isoaspartate(D-aspartate) O-methyltransferase
MVAQMLCLLDVRRGDRILEIGTGSGYNAALLATLAGDDGRVVTVDIEDDLIATARERFSGLGYPAIEAVHADAVRSLAGPFERIVVTARCNDIDPQWWRLLADRGRLVVPLDIGYGGERAYCFERHGNELHSVASHACAFIGIRSGEPERESAIFFGRRRSRYADRPSARTPLRVLAVELANATPELLERADAVVARPATIFALTASEG